MGYTPAALANYMTLLGWSPPEGMAERFSLAEAAGVFDFDRVNRAGAKFDWDRLNWLNSQVLHELSAEQLLAQLQPLWQAHGWGQVGGFADPAWQRELCALLGPSLTLLNDGIEQARPFFETPCPDEAALTQLRQDGVRAALEALLAALPAGAELPAESAQELLQGATAATGIKKGLLMKSLRAALLGSLQGADLISSWRLLHATDQDIPRLQAAIQSSMP